MLACLVTAKAGKSCCKRVSDRMLVSRDLKGKYKIKKMGKERELKIVFARSEKKLVLVVVLCF